MLDFDPMDDDGYPTEELCSFIESFDYRQGWVNLMDIIMKCWSYPHPYSNSYKEDGFIVYELSTGGWSGNEDLIGSLQDNHLFWLMNWHSSRRGGHYVFKVKDAK